MQNILFIGAGSMAEAMIHGFTAQKVLIPENIIITNKQNKDRLKTLQTTYGVTPVDDLARAVQTADLIVLAMKPKDVATSLVNLASMIGTYTPVLSIVAGYSIASIVEMIGDRPIARIMPNTSAQIGMSTTGVAFNPQSDADFKADIHTLLTAIGSVVEVDEDQLHAVTALSGSGPAYFYYVVEAMKAAGITYGLSDAIVEKLVVETMAGASEMLKRAGEPPEVLRKKITSPGGTTAAGIAALEQFDVKQAFTSCIAQAETKSRELAQS